MTPALLEAIAAHRTQVATALCTADGQRHMRLERRDGTPCSLHEHAADAVVELTYPLVERLEHIEELCKLAERCWERNATQASTSQLIPPFDRLGVKRLRAILAGRLDTDLATPGEHAGVKGPVHPEPVVSWAHTSRRPEGAPY